VERLCLLHMHLISYSVTEIDVISQHKKFFFGGGGGGKNMDIGHTLEK